VSTPGVSRSAIRPFLKEMVKHLEETPFVEKPIPLDNWAVMAGLTKGSFIFALRAEDIELYNTYRNRLAKYYSDVRADVLAAQSSRLCDLESVSEKYSLTTLALQAIARRLGRSAPSRKTILAEKICKVAKLGMTVKQLAAAAGMHPGSLKSAKNLGRLDGAVEFEVRPLLTPAGGKTRAAVICWIKEPSRRQNRA
jgi:hypothetical protein